MNKIKKENLPQLQDIKEIFALPDFTEVSLVAMVSKSAIQPKKTEGEFFLSMTLTDKTGTIDMPIWDDFKELANDLPIGTIVFVQGTKKSFDSRAQLGKKSILICDGFTNTDFMPKYNIVLKNLTIELLSYIKKIKDERYIHVIEELLGIKLTDKLEIVDKEKWRAFLTCPAASKNHGNKVHGLLLHTLGVLRTINNLVNLHSDFVDINTEEAIDKDMLYFMALVHDYGKIYEYTYDVTITKKDNLYVSHDVFLVGELQYINLCLGKIFSDEEMSKMFFISLTHHGEFANYKVDEKGNYKSKYPLEAKLLHHADMIDSQLVGEAEKIALQQN